MGCRSLPASGSRRSHNAVHRSADRVRSDRSRHRRHRHHGRARAPPVSVLRIPGSRTRAPPRLRIRLGIHRHLCRRPRPAPARLFVARRPHHRRHRRSPLRRSLGCDVSPRRLLRGIHVPRLRPVHRHPRYRLLVGSLLVLPPLRTPARVEPRRISGWTRRRRRRQSHLLPQPLVHRLALVGRRLPRLRGTGASPTSSAPPTADSSPRATSSPNIPSASHSGAAAPPVPRAASSSSRCCWSSRCSWPRGGASAEKNPSREWPGAPAVCRRIHRNNPDPSSRSATAIRSAGMSPDPFSPLVPRECR